MYLASAIGSSSLVEVPLQPSLPLSPSTLRTVRLRTHLRQRQLRSPPVSYIPASAALGLRSGLVQHPSSVQEAANQQGPHELLVGLTSSAGASFGVGNRCCTILIRSDKSVFRLRSISRSLGPSVFVLPFDDQSSFRHLPSEKD